MERGVEDLSTLQLCMYQILSVQYKTVDILGAWSIKTLNILYIFTSFT